MRPQPRRPHRMLDVVQAVAAYQQDRGPMADARLIEQGYAPKEADKALEDAEDRGYIESGVSTRTGWLTEKGRALLP